MSQRPRSASVPPRGGIRIVAGAPVGQQRQEQQRQSAAAAASASSARSSPARTPRHQPSFDNVELEVSTQIDVVPMMMTSRGMVQMAASPPDNDPMMNLQIPDDWWEHPTAAGMAAQAARSAGSLEPSLLNLLGSLGGGARNDQNGGDDAGMLNVIRAILEEITSAVGAPAGSQQPANIRSFLESLPDYSYTEGESLVTDLLMMLARSMTFRDLINVVLGSAQNVNAMQEPLREFLHRHVLVPPNDDENHDVDAAVLHLVDTSFSQLEDIAQVANVRANVDFAETMHSFSAANLTYLADTILRATSVEEFGPLFRQRGNTFLARLTALCLRCFTDGNTSLERVVQNRLEAISGDVGANVRDWTLSAAMGHLRNYVAAMDRGGSGGGEDVEQYVVSRGPDAENRRGARQRRLQQHQAHEEETFATPRSSPVRMETEDTSSNSTPVVAAGCPTASVPKTDAVEIPAPPPVNSLAEQSFPEDVRTR
jgi:hypothetical protein